MSENCAYFSHSSIFSKIGCKCFDLLDTGGMYCRNGGYVSVAEMGKCGVGISCRNGGVLWKCGVVAKMGVCVVEMWGM